MHGVRPLTLLAFAILAACAGPRGASPSLQPRATETIDPRVPVEAPVNNRPVTASLAARLQALVAQAQSGDAAFAPAAARAEQLAASAGARGSESWTVSQEALSAAVAARAQTTRALGDIDALGASALQSQGGLAPADLAAITDAAAEVGAIDRRQSARLDAIQVRLGL
ncbi:hypothetical protein H9L13_05065 [Sphingomonas lutea]|uniref:Uncharacterized protein n=1 Tax=Sphingomonas lutea TaxID=1045317 RepID=A0A7G9SK72_9SPHN|nr:hypothetical protein [Sphingomonas lutea]QNN68247.1 hypothetical protein H9L13_05065 [Sphingomonas lutea]